MNLSDYLKTKPLPHQKKAMNYPRMVKVFEFVSENIKIKKPKTLIHIVGTNGKGTTGRTIAHLSQKSGLKTGHYSSPHVVKYNERFWINGADISDEKLEEHHKKLYSLIKDLETSYFEYTTLLAMFVFEKCDLVICEAGLGGEFDATNVCKKDLSIITPIGLDHQKFLGNSIEKIARTKINSFDENSKAIISFQKETEVFEIAKEVASNKNVELFFAQSKYKNEINKIKKFAGYLQENISLALESLDILNIKYNIQDIENLEFLGRFYSVSENVKVDVGHNILASKVIFDEISENTVLIYNSLKDKPYKEVLSILKSKLKRVEIIDLENTETVDFEDLKDTFSELNLEFKKFEKTESKENYLVFGSFFVAKEFLKREQK
jgi:dihydrofolate synthase/folylpolyglutamate synthase